MLDISNLIIKDINDGMDSSIIEEYKNADSLLKTILIRLLRCQSKFMLDGEIIELSKKDVDTIIYDGPIDLLIERMTVILMANGSHNITKDYDVHSRVRYELDIQCLQNTIRDHITIKNYLLIAANCTRSMYDQIQHHLKRNIDSFIEKLENQGYLKCDQ